MGILSYLLSYVYAPKSAAGPPSASVLADGLLRDIQALEAGSQDPTLKKKIMGKAKGIIQQVGGNEMIIPQYAVTVSPLSSPPSPLPPSQKTGPANIPR